MKTFVKSVVLLATVTALGGCAALTAGSDRVVDRAGEAVDGYCTEISEESREAVRARINHATAPHVVTIECEEVE